MLFSYLFGPVPTPGSCDFYQSEHHTERPTEEQVKCEFLSVVLIITFYNALKKLLWTTITGVSLFSVKHKECRMHSNDAIHRLYLQPTTIIDKLMARYGMSLFQKSWIRQAKLVN